MKQNHEMWDAAYNVVRNAEERGYRTVIQPDKSIGIMIDGKLVDVIPPNIDQIATA
jgi:hypothetical protein